MEFRTLRADEIDVRIGHTKNNGSMLLLYKDARADMNVLDESVGPMNWKREHKIVGDNLFCTVSVFNNQTNEWISKQDVGTESNTEKEKGQASDSFKRACVNWGIGRELYTAPFIWVSETNKYQKYKVSHIEYNDNRVITALIIETDKGKQVFSYGSNGVSKNKPKSKPKQQSSKPQEQKAEETLTCSDCDAPLQKAESVKSLQFYGKELCEGCQENNEKI